MTSVREKITRTYIFVSVAVILLLLLPLSLSIENYFYDRLFTELKTETGMLLHLLREYDADERNPGGMINSLYAVSSMTGTRITLIDSTGVVIFESSVPDSQWHTMENHLSRPEVQEALRSGIGTNTRPSGTLGLDMLYVARAVEPSQFRHPFLGRLRFIRAGIISVDVTRQIAEIRWILAVGGLGAVVLILVASRIVSAKIARPIVEIANIVAAIRTGDLERKLPVRSDDEIGRLAGAINEMTDKLKDDIAQLKRLERFRSEFLGNVSHELRTPLFSLKGFLETLMEGAMDDATVSRQFLEKAYHHASRLDALLKDLIEISRIESGDMRMSFRYFDVPAFLDQIKIDFNDEAQRKGQSLMVEVIGADVKAFGDKDRLRQAMDSLVENAVKYSQEGAHITLKAEDRPSSVRIAVIDDGPGIPAEHIPRIFERFYRVDKDRSREVGGTGLGLAIAKHIVEAHGSQIRVESRVGKGSTFLFELKK